MSAVDDVANFIRGRDKFLFVTHVFPDGDNMGSILAMSEGLRQFGKICSCYVEGKLPAIFTWMPGADEVESDIDRAVAKLGCDGECPVIFALDSGDIHRMGDSFDKWIENYGGSDKTDRLEIINVDHHVTNTRFGKINWADGGYSSTGEMVYEILKELGAKITSSIAMNLYVSVYTDTGRFSFSNTSERSLKYAAEYVAAGAKPIDAFRGVYANRSLSSFHLQSASFQTLERFLDGRGCYFYVDQAMLELTGTSMDDTEGFIDSVRTLRDFEIVAFFKEISPLDIRVSARAHPPINASLLMGLFGGGGHPRAAGARLDMPLKKAIEYFVKVSEEAIESGRGLEK
jgi:bifunctional oligoribonuclease and PAP phosphatase NrnA